MIQARKGLGWRRISYGPFRIWEDGYITGAGYVNLVRRKTERVYLIVPVYENGRYPYFPRNKLTASYIMELPKPMILNIAKRIKKNKIRIRAKKEHKWKIKLFKLEEPKE